MGRLLVLTLGGLFLAGWVVVAVNVVRVGLADPPPGPGVDAPGFALTALDADAPTALAAHAGDVVLLEFWTSTCVGCIGATPKLNRLHRRYGDDGLTLLSVNMDEDGGALARRVVEDRGLEYPVLLDDGAVARAYGIYATPTAVLVGRDGTIRAVHKGNVTEQRLQTEIEALLAEPAS